MKIQVRNGHRVLKNSDLFFYLKINEYRGFFFYNKINVFNLKKDNDSRWNYNDFGNERGCTCGTFSNSHSRSVPRRRCAPNIRAGMSGKTLFIPATTRKHATHLLTGEMMDRGMQGTMEQRRKELQLPVSQR